LISYNGRIIFNQPPVVAYDFETSSKTGKDEVPYFGEYAYNRIGKEPENIVIKFAIQNNKITDLKSLEYLIKTILTNLGIMDAEKLKNCLAVVATSSGIMKLDKVLLRELLSKMGVHRVVVENQVKLAALGVGLNIWSPSGLLVLYIGKEVSDSTLIASGEIIIGKSIPIASNSINQNESIAAAIQPIVDMVIKVIDHAGPSFSQTITDNGCIICGDGALIQGIDESLKIKLNVPVQIAQYPEHCIVRGAEVYQMRKEELYTQGYLRPSQ